MSDIPSGIGFVGLGAMGAPMLRNLLRHPPAGRAVSTWARRPEVLAEFADAGADLPDTPAALAARSEIVVCMLPDLPQLQLLLEGPDGLMAGADGHDLVLIVCSSVSPTRIRTLGDDLAAASAGRVRLVDAPVSGGVEGAAAGTLSIMVGGESSDVARAWPVLETFGTPVLLGPLGSGEVAKACNQLIVSATMTALAEAAVIAERAGLDLEALFDLLAMGYAGSRLLDVKRRAITAADYTPGGVARYMVKDLAAAHEEAVAHGVDAPQLESVRHVFDGLVKAGMGDDDLAVVHRFVRERRAS